MFLRNKPLKKNRRFRKTFLSTLISGFTILIASQLSTEEAIAEEPPTINNVIHEHSLLSSYAEISVFLSEYNHENISKETNSPTTHHNSILDVKLSEQAQKLNVPEMDTQTVSLEQSFLNDTSAAETYEASVSPTLVASESSSSIASTTADSNSSGLSTKSILLGVVGLGGLGAVAAGGGGGGGGGTSGSNGGGNTPSIHDPDGDGIPEAELRNEVEIGEGDTFYFTEQHFDTAQLLPEDGSIPASALRYEIVQDAQSGQLTSYLSPSQNITSFSHGDIHTISYQHDHSNTTADTVKLHVYHDTTNDFLGTIEFNIGVVPIDDDPPVEIVSSGLTMAEDETAVISADLLAFTDTEKSAAELEYLLTSQVHYIAGIGVGHLELTTNPGTAIETFSQDDIDNGRLVYIHDDERKFYNELVFSVSDGNHFVTDVTFNITLVDNTPPSKVNNNSLTVQAIDGESRVMIEADRLQYEDRQPTDQITYTITTAAEHGHLEDMQGNVIPSFTQADINNGNVFYVFEGTTQTMDSFEFSITDGLGTDSDHTAHGIVFDVKIEHAVTYRLPEGMTSNIDAIRGESILQVNGEAVNPGDTITTSRGGMVTLNADGSLSYQATSTGDDPASNFAFVPPQGGQQLELGIIPRTAFGDLNGDGHPEIIVGGFSDLDFYYGQGNFEFTEVHSDEPDHPLAAVEDYISSNDLVAHAPVLMDIDKDGDLDLIMTASDYNNNTIGIHYFENDGDDTNPNFVVPADNVNPFGSINQASWQGDIFYPSLAIEDIDHDGDDDVVIGSKNGTNNPLRYFENTGSDYEERTGTENPFAHIHPIDSESYVSHLFADINQDGYKDLVLVEPSNKESTASIFLHTDVGYVKSESALPEDFHYFLSTKDFPSVTAYDVYGSGLVDLVIAGPGDMSLFVNTRQTPEPVSFDILQDAANSFYTFVPVGARPFLVSKVWDGNGDPLTDSISTDLTSDIFTYVTEDPATGENYETEVRVQHVDLDSDGQIDLLNNLVIADTSAGDRISINVELGGLHYNPPQGFNGVDRFYYQLNDSNDPTAFTEVELWVRELVDISSDNDETVSATGLYRQIVVDENSGHDTVEQFLTDREDVIDFSSVDSVESIGDLQISEANDNTVLSWGNDNSLTLQGVDQSALNDDLFIF